jgi:alpha-D-xyloside xylohydrolase
LKSFTKKLKSGFIWSKSHEQVLVEPWGKNGVRIRVSRGEKIIDELNGLLDNPPTPKKAKVDISDSEVTLRNGEVTVRLSGRFGTLEFIRTSDQTLLLKEKLKTTAEYHGRNFIPKTSAWKIEQRFFSDDNEKIYGLGQRQHGYLNQKGCILDLIHRNTEVSIPFMLSNMGYGFLWNNPGMGRVELGRNETRWVVDSAQQIDYYVVIDDSPSNILERYAEVTGKPSKFPEWGSGFWQCKLRYKTQAELVSVAKEYHRRKLPVSVMVIDFHHWSKSGDWSFDPECWPNPAKMVRDLKKMGMECMVSVWPTVDYSCANFKQMQEHGLTIRNEKGMSLQNGANLETFYDATHPQGRKFLWEQIKKGYVDHGIKLFWLDTIEPEIIPLEPENTRYHLGNGAEVGGVYPKCHQQAFFEGLKTEGEKAPMTLGRSAWVGSQRYGAAVWSADIPSTFESLQKQVAGGLNIALAGIPWWTTDIGGFHGGDIESEDYRELITRWFQYGVFCPIMRLHGVRKQSGSVSPKGVAKADPNHPNVGNEVWSYGEETCAILSDLIHLRERLRPYIMKQMQIASSKGLPPMRPIFVDFPDDELCWDIEDQFMFGSEILVAPILKKQTFKRMVYLPAGQKWKHAYSGELFEGGQSYEIQAPIDQIPFFMTETSKLNLIERSKDKHITQAYGKSMQQDRSRFDLFFSPDTSPEEFKKRRIALTKRLPKNTHALISSAPLKPNEAPYQDASFYYLSGLEINHSFLLIDCNSGHTVLFIPEGSESGEHGPEALGIENANFLKKKWLFDEVKSPSMLDGYLSKTKTIYTPCNPVEAEGASIFMIKAHERKMKENEWEQEEARHERLRRLISVKHPQIQFEDLMPFIRSMRTIKSESEIDIMRQAGRLSAKVISESMKATRPGTTEMQLHAIAEYVYRQFGHCDKGYSVIAASGHNTLQGHYGKNNVTLQDGEIILMDSGPSLRHYSSDIGRIWPINGKYNEWQRNVYGMIVDYQKEIIKLIKPGNKPREIYAEANKIMKKRSTQKTYPYAKVNHILDQVIASKTRYLNHCVGMSVHDAVEPWHEEPLKTGVVMAVDPMVTCKKEGYYIRIEDTALVTSDGCEVFTKDAPSDLDDVEALMKQPSSFLI